jgi:hypothetical protein
MFILTFGLQKTSSRPIITALRIRRQRRGVEDTQPAKVLPTPNSQTSFQKGIQRASHDSSKIMKTYENCCEVVSSNIMWWLKNSFFDIRSLDDDHFGMF